MEPWLEAFALTNFLRSTDTAHDLKTPLNVAVLNLELMRMRIRKLAGGAEDEKIAAYASSIELELRRLARIFDAFFVLSTPPKGEAEPAVVDLAAIAREFTNAACEPSPVRAHESRIRQALQYFVEGAGKVLKSQRIAATRDASYRLTIAGEPHAEDLELTKIFKFYYTDADGTPDLSLAAARIIAETYGGTLTAEQDGVVVSLTLSLPIAPST
jgi:K+-sensing histidine kinase KdpD